MPHDLVHNGFFFHDLPASLEATLLLAEGALEDGVSRKYLISKGYHHQLIR